LARLKIQTFPDVVLSQVAQPFERVEKDVRRLVDDMLETMYNAPGVGLAANQVGILKRILVVDTGFEMEDLPEDGSVPEGAEVVAGALISNKKPIVVINPEIVLKEAKIVFSEGCLSVPGFNAEVTRSDKIKIRYLDVDGVARELRAEGFQAVAFQHEIDHLDGKLFIDRLNPLKKKMVKRRLLEERKERDERGDDFPEPRQPRGSRRSKGL